MAIYTLYDFTQSEHARNYILQRWVETVIAQRYASLQTTERITATILALLEGLVERGDIAKLIQLPCGNFGGYALLSEHKNTWTGCPEGFIYTLNIEQHLLSTSLMPELLASIYRWARERGYKLIRVEVPECASFQPIITYLQASGWMTSCFIPYKIVSSPLESFVRNLILQNSKEIHIRAAIEDDYPFIFQLLAEATWSGLSSSEKSMMNYEALVKNIRRDFEPMLKEGVAWSLVAESTEKRLCAHATVLEGTNDLLDRAEAELVDTFVLPAYTGCQLGSRLTAHVLDVCLSKGIQLVYGSLVAEAVSKEEIQRIRANLEQTGWWMSSVMMYWDRTSSERLNG